MEGERRAGECGSTAQVEGLKAITWLVQTHERYDTFM